MSQPRSVRPRALAVILVACALLSLPLGLLPGAMAQEPALEQVGPHTIQISRGGLDSETHVFESLFFSNAGGGSYDGALEFRLDDGATGVVASFWQINETSNSRIPAERGVGNTGGAIWETQEADGLLVHSIDLADLELSLGADEAIGVDLRYTVAGDDRTIARGFAHDVGDLSVSAQLPSGLVPRSETLEFAHMGGSVYRTAGADLGFQSGDTFRISFEESQVPTTPLSVRLVSTGNDAGTLRAQATGGIGDYNYTWYRDGEELTAAAGSSTLEIDQDDLEGTHTFRVVVSDAADPAGTAEARFLVYAPASDGAVGPVPGGEGVGDVLAAVIGALIGAAVIYGLVVAGLVGGRKPVETRPSGQGSIAAESREMLELRKRTNMAALKELELAKKKGEVSEGQYLPLKEELKASTVRVMRELEKRQTETV